MTVVLTLDDTQTYLDRAIELDDLKKLIVIVCASDLQCVSTIGESAHTFDFDDDDLITWEDTEWQ